MTEHDLIATAALGTEDLVAAELRALGATSVEPGRALVRFAGSLEVAYRACLWSRVASRVILPVARVAAPTQAALYEAVRALPWPDHLGPDDTLAVDFSGRGPAVSHTQYGARLVKDAIVDHLRDRFGRRPSVALDEPRVRVSVRLESEKASVGIDLAGASLHRRGYRREAGEAPLRETLAAAVLLRSRWPDAAAAGQPLVDPMCGSGTLVLEAALVALDAAPGLGRTYFGLLGWRGHDPALWARLVAEARERRQSSYAAPLVGSDRDGRAIATARANAADAGLASVVTLEQRPLSDVVAPGGATGHVVVNPPYGERLGDPRELGALYGELGRVLKDRFAGWQAHVLTSSAELAHEMGLSPSRVNKLFNGAIPVELWHCDVRERRAGDRREHGEPRDRSGGVRPEHGHAREAPAGSRPAPRPTPGPVDEALGNRLRKNLKKLRPWAEREGITCYRVYDADLPELAAAVDVYEDLVHVQEYAPPASVDPELARRRLDSLVATVAEVLETPRDKLFVKTRRAQKAGARYGRLAARAVEREVRESGHRFVVNLSDRIDTGLFLDSRLVRRKVAELAPGKRFLNLFCYTGTATVYAARAGARSTTSVDLSKSYLAWAERNLELNGVRGAHHRLVQADGRVYLAESRDRFDLVLLDPPTFSNSKRMEGTLDVQRDHRELVGAALDLLTPGGTLLFVTNYRRFRLDESAFPGVDIQDLSAETLPLDFARNPRIHRCWRLTRR